jgi:hypothetical protein
MTFFQESSWEEYLEQPHDYVNSCPLQRLCSQDFICGTDWIDTLTSDSPINPPPPPIHFPHNEPRHELEDRGIEISSFNLQTITREIIEFRSRKYGEILEIDMSEMLSGKIIVKFFDLRSSIAMRFSMIIENGFQWHLQFAHPTKITSTHNPPNSGTIVLFHVPSDVTIDSVYSVFKQSGSIREVRTSGDHFFVEFWDLRSSERALKRLRRQKPFGKQVSGEYSRPGGIWKNPDAFLCYRQPIVVRGVNQTKPTITIHRECVGVAH